MNGTAPDGSQQSPSSGSSALLWTLALVAVVAGLGLYLARGQRQAADAGDAPAEPVAAASPIAAAPDPAPTLPPPPNYFTLPPCRLFDGMVAAGASVFDLNPACGLPATATSVAVVVSVIDPGEAGTLGFHAADAGGDGAAAAATIEFQAGRPRNGAAYLKTPADGSARVGVRNSATVPVRVLLDVSGYFE